jgi:nucleotide-binding universal stress UspA family protein
MTRPADRRTPHRPCIVVGYDGSEAAREAVAYAAERAGSDGRLFIVHAYGSHPDWLDPPYQQMADQQESHGRAVLDALLLEAGNALLDLDFELELAHGPAAKAIAKVAADKDADEIVIGSRGFGKARSVLGSVSHELLHEADRPVVVIPYKFVREHAGAGS